MKAKVIDGALVKFPYTRADLKKDYPGVSFPRAEFNQEDYNIVDVVAGSEPQYDPATQRLVAGDPVLVGEVWTVPYEVVPIPAKDLAEQQERQRQETLVEAARLDAQIRNLFKATPEQIDAKIDSTVTNLNSAKEVIKILARATAALSGSILR